MNKKWHKLTDCEIGEFLYDILLNSKSNTNIVKIIKKIDKKLKEKNA